MCIGYIHKDFNKFFIFFWCSEFSDIFDLDHFKSVLANDVRIISSLPSTHLMSRPVEEKHTPLHVSPQWIRARYLSRVIYSYVASALMAFFLKRLFCMDFKTMGKKPNILVTVSFMGGFMGLDCCFVMVSECLCSILLVR